MPRPRLTEDEMQVLKRLRSGGAMTALMEECDEAGISPSSVKHFWYKSKRISLFSKAQDLSLDELFEPVLADLRKYSPKFKAFKRKKIKDPHCLILDPSDIHVGKLAVKEETGSNYNVKEAVACVDRGIDDLLRMSQGWEIEQVYMVIGNDCLHIDSQRPVTTAGTPQDMDGLWWQSFIQCKDLMVRAIERLLPYANVTVIHCPSNHDYVAGWMLAQTLKAYFRKSKNVTFDISINHRKYVQFGSNMLGFSHGDGAKLADTPLLMAQEEPEMWAATKHRTIYLHHLHHRSVTKWPGPWQSAKDYIGVTAEHIRSPSGTDSWHHKKGYVGVPRCVEAFIHHNSDGQVARLTHHIKRG